MESLLKCTMTEICHFPASSLWQHAMLLTAVSGARQAPSSDYSCVGSYCICPYAHSCMCAHIDEPSVPSHVFTALWLPYTLQFFFLVTPSDSQVVIGASVSVSIFHFGTFSSMAA